MNIRIRELAEQAIIPFKDENLIVCYHFSKEKFAELIVRECITVLDENDGVTHHTELLKKHFGVEE